MEQIKSWEMRGEYCETCNCDILCPCLPTNTTAMPTQVHCDVMLAYHIEQGSVGDVSLDGLSFVIALQTPGAMIEGHAKVAIYIDEKANDIRHMFEARLITRKEYGELIRKLEEEVSDVITGEL